MSPYLRFVEFRNFKVYKHSDFGPFEPRTLYAILGRNGVGKSSFIDGIAFVFGEQNLLKLRASAVRRLRLYETPFSTPNMAREEDCSVAAIFCLDDEQPKRFERKLDHDDSNVFLINHEVVTIDHYLEELLALQIDVSLPHFNLSVETISKVALKSPYEIRDFFEEVSGSSALKEQYDTLKREERKINLSISLTKEERSFASECFKEASDDADRISKTESMHKEVLEARKEWALFILHYYEDIKNACETEILKTEKDVHDLKFHIEKKESELSEKEENLKHLSDLKSDLRAQLMDLQLKSDRKALVQLQEVGKYLNKKLNQDKESHQKVSSKLQESEKLIELTQERLTAIVNLVQELSDSCTCIIERNSAQYEEYLLLKMQFFSLNFSAKLERLKLNQANDFNWREVHQSLRDSFLERLQASQPLEGKLRAEYDRVEEDLRTLEREQDERNRLKLQISRMDKELLHITSCLRDARGDREEDIANLKENQRCLIRNIADLRKSLDGRNRIDKSHREKLMMRLSSMGEQVKSAEKQVQETQKSFNEIEDKIRLLDETIAHREKEITSLESELAFKAEDFFADFCAKVGVANIQECDQPCKYCKEDKTKKLELACEEEVLKVKLAMLTETAVETRNKLTYLDNDVVKRKKQIKEARKEMNDVLKSQQNKIVELTEEISSKSSEQEALERDIRGLREHIRCKKIERGQLCEAGHQSRSYLSDWESSMREACGVLSCVPEGSNEEWFIDEETSTSEGGSCSAKSSSEEDVMQFDVHGVAERCNFDEMDENLKSITNIDEIFEQARKLRDRKDRVQKVFEQSPEEFKRTTLMPYEDAKKALSDSKKALKSWETKLSENSAALKHVKQERKRLLNACFHAVSKTVSTWFEAVTGCDQAKIYLTPCNQEEPYLDGIVMSYTLPEQPINTARDALSLGERCQLSLAFLLSCDSHRRTSICLADEVDSQCDPTRSACFARAYGVKAQTSQVFVVSHRETFYENSDVLISIRKNGAVLYLDQRNAENIGTEEKDGPDNLNEKA